MSDLTARAARSRATGNPVALRVSADDVRVFIGS